MSLHDALHTIDPNILILSVDMHFGAEGLVQPTEFSNSLKEYPVIAKVANHLTDKMNAVIDSMGLDEEAASIMRMTAYAVLGAVATGAIAEKLEEEVELGGFLN